MCLTRTKIMTRLPRKKLHARDQDWLKLYERGLSCVQIAKDYGTYRKYVELRLRHARQARQAATGEIPVTLNLKSSELDMLRAGLALLADAMRCTTPKELARWPAEDVTQLSKRLPTALDANLYVGSRVPRVARFPKS